MERLCYEYAKLIADAAIEGRQGLVLADRHGKDYWSFTTMTYRKFVAGKISPSALLQENKMLVVSEPACGYCGTPGRLHWEHLFPISRGGPDTIDNLIRACPACNLQKGALNPIDWYDKRGINWKQIPRLVMGKCLKLVWDEHRKRGTLADTEFPLGQELDTARLFRVFELPDGGTKSEAAGTRPSSDRLADPTKANPC